MIQESIRIEQRTTIFNMTIHIHTHTHINVHVGFWGMTIVMIYDRADLFPDCCGS